MAEALLCNFHPELLALALEINLLDPTLLYWKWPSSFLTSLEGMMDKTNTREACSILLMLILWIWLIVVGFVIFFVLQGVIYCLLFKRLLWTIQSLAFLLDPSAVFAGNLQLTLVVDGEDCASNSGSQIPFGLFFFMSILPPPIFFYQKIIILGFESSLGIPWKRTWKWCSESLVITSFWAPIKSSKWQKKVNIWCQTS